MRRGMTCPQTPVRLGGGVGFEATEGDDGLSEEGDHRMSLKSLSTRRAT